jgi:phospholipase D1/2
MSARLRPPGRTVWRVEPCRRAAVLIDGAAFFAAAREAFLAAERCIFVVGWDIDSRTELVGETPPTDGLPTAFGSFLTELVKRKPNLRIHLLLWDYSLLYAHEREPLPRLALDWQMPPQVTFCLDATVPFGSSQHQKLVIVDDTLAFSGGLDITIRRWDTSRHELDQPDRVDPAGEPYKPFHDIQMMVDGKAAEALALLARRRWCHATEGQPDIEPIGDPWPSSFAPDFTDVEIGISRTQPRYGDEKEVREVETLFLDSIDRAERYLYIENQFATAPRIADRLARRLRQNQRLEVVIVAPHAHESLVERRTMRNGRIRFWRTVRQAGGARVRLVSPSVEKDGRTVDTMIHSKIMVIDDWFLRVGSANLNNRSMGADTECDLVIEAADERQRAAIVELRNRMLGEHCGTSADQVAATLASNPSLVALADTLSCNGHRLKPIDDGTPDRTLMARVAERIADPARPLRWSRLIGHFLPQLVGRPSHRRRDARPGGGSLLVAGFVTAMLALTLAWNLTGLSEYADPTRVRELLAGLTESGWALPAVVGCFVLGGAVSFPVVILILATAALFGPWRGLAASALGGAASATLMFGAGARFGRRTLSRIGGTRWHRLRDYLQRRGLLAVVALRVMPVAPFTVVNVAVGAGGIRFVDFALGTVIGMGPGLTALCFMGDRIARLVEDPSAGQVALLALIAAGWIGISLVAQTVVSRLADRPT